MICPKCGNLISYNSYFGAYYCSMCGEYFQEIKKINADKIRSMSDEELADYLWRAGHNYRQLRNSPVEDHDEYMKILIDFLKKPVGEV